jgi:CheY-like chemotaxis protein
MWQTMQRPDDGSLGSLPAADDISALREEPTNPTVLLVEDEVVVNFFLKTLFEDRGFQVVMTTTAAEALRAIDDWPGELCAAVIDVGLPDQPGDQLVPLIRSSFPELPIVIATGFSEAEFGMRFQDDNRVRVIGKPFDGPHLFSALSSLDEQFAT